jgi:hypothetical protein
MAEWLPTLTEQPTLAGWDISHKAPESLSNMVSFSAGSELNLFRPEEGMLDPDRSVRCNPVNNNLDPIWLLSGWAEGSYYFVEAVTHNNFNPDWVSAVDIVYDVGMVLVPWGLGHIAAPVLGDIVGIGIGLYATYKDWVEPLTVYTIRQPLFGYPEVLKNPPYPPYNNVTPVGTPQPCPWAGYY